MKSRETLDEPNEGTEELARVRAEVARALSAQPPDVAVLSAALEQVETLLAKAREDLVAVVREIQGSREVEPVVATEPSPRYVRGFFPWG